MEEKEKLHRETVERLQTQVRGGFSTLCEITLPKQPRSSIHCFTPFIIVGAAGEERARKMEPFCRPVGYR